MKPRARGVRARAVASALACALAAGCAVQRPEGYVDALAAGDRAMSAGRVREAAQDYDRAATQTRRPLDHDEAVYRAGQAYRRAGDTARALERFDALWATGSAQARAGRGALVAAQLRYDRGDAAAAEAGLDALVRRYPDSGPAARAVVLVLAARDARDPSGASALAWVNATLPAVARTELEATLRFERARRLERAGQVAQAVEAYEALLAIPYPGNARWDDGGLDYARLLVAQGRPRDAVRVIDRVLAVREVPVLTGGSYERPHFADLALLRARVLRDDVRDWAAAADAFHFVYERFRTSRLRDDALLEEAELRVALGQAREACELFQVLASEFPCTRRGREGDARARACGQRGTPREALAQCRDP
jgi:tetratricopeptide (TPR) repeat protein